MSDTLRDGMMAQSEFAMNVRTQIKLDPAVQRQAQAKAAELGISPGSVGNLFGEFTCHHLAKRSYSADWDDAWRRYVETSEEILARWRAASQAAVRW